MDTKVCSKCHEEKPLDAFYTQKRKDGSLFHRAQCRACKSAARAKQHERARAGKKRTHLRQRKNETYREFQHRVIADAVARARQRLIAKGVQVP